MRKESDYNTLEKNKEKKESQEFEFKNQPTYDYLLMFKVINRHYSLKKLLDDLGWDMWGSSIYCPFHEDKLTGKPSAKYFPDSDSLYCFSEGKSFTAYHALKVFYNKNMKKVFEECWNKLDSSDKERLIREHGEGVNIGSKDFIPDYWKRCKIILGKFKLKEITFRQHKNALYKIFRTMYDDNLEEIQK